MSFPSSTAERARIPEDWTVWAFTDIHGNLGGLRAALGEAALIDGDGYWRGAQKVALVGVGDYIDRGPDSAGLIAFLRLLEAEMTASGSRLVLVRGNHEQMLADILRGSDEWFEAWAINGGHALARSYSLDGARRPIDQFRRDLLERDPALLGWLLGTLPYAVWRDVLFVHAAPVPGGDLVTLGDSDRQLWEQDVFVSSAGIEFEPAYEGYRAAGIRRVIVGHLPQAGGPAVDHAGSLLLLDANAAGIGPRMTAVVALVEVPPDERLDAARIILASSGS